MIRQGKEEGERSVPRARTGRPKVRTSMEEQVVSLALASVSGGEGDEARILWAEVEAALELRAVVRSQCAEESRVAHACEVGQLLELVTNCT